MENVSDSNTAKTAIKKTVKSSIAKTESKTEGKTEGKTESKTKGKSKKTIDDGDIDVSKLYQRKSDIQHIRDNPDTYMGSVEISSGEYYIIDEDGNIELKSIECIQGFYKIFDEAITNSKDHYTRMNEKIKLKDDAKSDAKIYSVTKIAVNISE